MQFPKKIWHIVNDPSFHCMFWLGIHCDPNPKAEEYPQKQMRCSTSFIVSKFGYFLYFVPSIFQINKRWAKQPGQVLDNTKQANILFNTQNLGSAPTTYIGCRVGSDFPKTSTWSVGSVGSGRVIWSVGCRDFSGSTLPKKMIKIADKIRKRYFFGLSFMWSRLCEHFSFSDDSLLFFLI